MSFQADRAPKGFSLPPDVYDQFVDWPKRLGKEGPFFQFLFSRFGVKRIWDAACGTGRHADLFHSWGLEVEATDISGEMIAFARSRHGSPPGLTWRVHDFLSPHPQPESFDAAVCLGNSLSLAPGLDEAKRVVGNLFAAVKPGGIVVLHVLNYEAIPKGRSIWQKVTWTNVQERQVLALKGIHRLGDRALVSFVLVDPEIPQVVTAANELLLCDVLAAVEAFVEDVKPKQVTCYLDYIPEAGVTIRPGGLRKLPLCQDVLVVIEK